VLNYGPLSAWAVKTAHVQESNEEESSVKRFVGIFAVVFALALTTWASTEKVLWNFGGGSDGSGRGAIISSATPKVISMQRQLPAEPIPPELCSCCLLHARKQFSMNSKVKPKEMVLLLMVVWRSMPMASYMALPRVAGPTVQEPSIGYLQNVVADGQRR
jgi:hypothetical protein